MSELGMYLFHNTRYCVETRNLIEDVINSIVHNTPFLNVQLKTLMLKEALRGMDFSEEQLTAFSKGEVPTEYQVVPVEATVTRLYRIYVKVPKGSDSSMIKDAAKKQILDNGLDESDLAPDWDIERDDIVDLGIDWAGAQEADE